VKNGKYIFKIKMATSADQLLEAVLSVDLDKIKTLAKTI
jgi:hypothetical protein